MASYTLIERSRFRVLPARESNATKTPSWTKERGEEMLAMMPPGLLDGLLSGLEAQSELSELLRQLFYDALS